MNNKGSILIITLWVLALLVIFSLGMGWRASADMRISAYQRDKLIAGYLSRGAVTRQIWLLNKDKVDTLTGDYDSLSECGVNTDGKGPEDIFNWKNANMSYSVGYEDGSGNYCLGNSDESARFNINMSSQENDVYFLSLVALLKDKQIEDPDKLAEVIAGWIKQDSELPGAKKELYKVPEEVILPLEFYYRQNGVSDYRKPAQELYDKINGMLTVFGDGKLNINTVPEALLRAYFTAVSSATETADSANSLAARIEDFRKQRQEDGKYGYFLRSDFEAGPEYLSLKEKIKTADDSLIELLVTAFNKGMSVSSDIYRIRVTANVNKAQAVIVQVYDRNDKKILYRRQN